MTGPMATREDFAGLLLHALDAPVTKRNLISLVTWMEGENTEAAFNPFATKQSMPGSTAFNPQGVRNYGSLADGVEATRRTLDYGMRHGLYGYDRIVRRLRANAMPRRTLRAVKASAWGTGELPLGSLKRVKADWDFYRNEAIPT